MTETETQDPETRPDASEKGAPAPDSSGWGSYAFFGASPAAVPPETERIGPPRPAAEAQPLAPADVDWLLVGPPEAGKTSLLAALQQGCLAEGTFDRFSHLVAEPALAGLASSVRESCRQSGAFFPEATRGVATYGFELGRRAGDLYERGIRVRAIELPPSLEYSRIRTSFELNAPVVSVAACLDLADLATSRRWLDRLPELLQELSLSYGAPRRRAAAGWLFSIDRLLLVFTKADLLVEGLRQELQRPGRRSDLPAACEEILASVDSVELLFQLAGPQMVKRIARSLDPRTSMAVALASAWGETVGGRQLHSEWRPAAVGAAVDFLVCGIESPGVAAIGRPTLAAGDRVI